MDLKPFPSIIVRLSFQIKRKLRINQTPFDFLLFSTPAHCDTFTIDHVAQYQVERKKARPGHHPKRAFTKTINAVNLSGFTGKVKGKVNL